MSGREVAKAASDVGGEAVVFGRARNGQEEGGVAPEDKFARGCGPAIAQCGAAKGQLGCHPAVVMSSEEGVHGAVHDVIAWRKLQTERARLLVKREHGESEACHRQVISPLEEGSVSWGSCTAGGGCG